MKRTAPLRFLISCSLALASSASAATFVWDGANLGDFLTGSNWLDGVAPVNGDASNEITISNGTFADYNPGGDFVSNGTFTVSGANSGWVTDDSNWSRFNGTVNVLNGGRIDRNSGGNLVFGSDNVASGSTIDLTVNGGIVETNSELWFGWNTAGVTQNVNVNVSGGGSLTSFGGGGASIFAWDNVIFNFTGAGTITANNQGIKYGANSGAGLTAGTWENQWAAGTLRFNGLSGQDGETFSDYFSTTGTNGSTVYTLTAVPEPSVSALFGLGGLALILRRRKS